MDSLELTGKLPQDIMNLLAKYAKEEDGFQYINPYFLSEIKAALYNYYKLEDDEVGEWVMDMYSA